ncbi:MAG TPA: glycosyltransferase family A protein [Gemmataceae bacterium]|nr:glycosyltransferase family A protein [Gemmataceae bacterium]
MLISDPVSVCVVVSDPGELPTSLDEHLRRGCAVHVLWCAPDAIPTALREAGVMLSVLDPADSPDAFRVQNLHEQSRADHADRVRHTLARLHREHNFDRIEFGARGGLGLRAIQAKRAGLGFDDVTLAVRLDTCSQWVREQEQRWPSGFEEVQIDYLERFAFENADLRLTPDPAVLEFVRRRGWESATQAGRPVPPDDLPPVTIGIAHFNLGRHLPETLASLAAQTYPNLEVIVIDDGSTDAHSVAVFEQLRERYPRFRFLRQPNAGIGATRNRCLELATGEFFIPVDADNVARPEMVERFVRAIGRNPHLSAMTCYFLAFEDGAPPGQFLHACRPTGGPHTLACIRNVYGDANAIFRTADFREVGGYETDRGTSCEDWEAFVKLVHAGKRIGVVPEHLFDYRHRPAGFSRATNWFANHQRVLRQFTRGGHLPAEEAEVLWTALLGFHLRLEQLEHPPPRLRDRVARGLKRLLAAV